MSENRLTKKDMKQMQKEWDEIDKAEAADKISKPAVNQLFRERNAFLSDIVNPLVLCFPELYGAGLTQRS